MVGSARRTQQLGKWFAPFAPRPVWLASAPDRECRAAASPVCRKGTFAMQWYNRLALGTLAAAAVAGASTTLTATGIATIMPNGVVIPNSGPTNSATDRAASAENSGRLTLAPAESNASPLRRPSEAANREAPREPAASRSAPASFTDASSAGNVDGDVDLVARNELARNELARNEVARNENRPPVYATAPQPGWNPIPAPPGPIMGTASFVPVGVCHCNGPDAVYTTGANEAYSPGWLPGPDGCPKPEIFYVSPRGPWYVMAEGIALKRDASDERVFATIGDPDTVALSTSDQRFEFEGGLKALLGHQFNDYYAIEASYFGLTTWDAQAAVRDVSVNGLGTTGNLFSPFSNFGDPAGIAGLDFNTLASIRTVSSLDNFELNIRQRIDTVPEPFQASVLYGVRYMNIRERFEYRTQSFSPAPGGAENAVNVHTGNDLIGFQIGGALEARIEPRGWINFEVKGAVCHNGADQASDYTFGPLAGPQTTIAGARAEERTAFVGDVSLSFMYQFSRRLVGRIGYQSIWVDGVALASENFESNVNRLTLGPPQLVHDGGLVYHGPFAGLMYSW
jgi:hypothetical protein